MKTKLTIGIAALISATMLSLTACGPDEPEPTPNPEPTPDGLTDKWVLSSYRNADYQNSTRLKYDNKGRVIEVTRDNDDYVDTYTYSSNSIGWEYKSTKYPSSRPEKIAYQLSAGLISSVYHQEETEAEFTYNSYGQMTRVNEYGEDFYSMKWDNGNLTEIRCSVLLSDYGNEYREEYDLVVNYNGNNTVDQSCIKALNAFILDELNEFGLEQELAFSGYFGEMPAQLISGIRSTYGNDYLPNMVTYRDIDANGCPGEMTITDGRQQSTTYYLTWQKL